MTTTTKPDPTTTAATSSPTSSTLPAPVEPKTPVLFGVTPRTLDEAWRIANVLAKSELVPKDYREQPANVLVAIMHGAELGLAPMQAMQSIAVVNGRPSIWGDGLLAVIVASPVYQDHDEYYEVDGQRRDGLVVEDWKKDTTAAVCMFIRRDKAEPITRRFTVAQAKKANLIGKPGPWQTHPDRMLAMRARGFAARDAFPDVLRGMVSREEAIDMPVDEPADAPPRREVRRMSETPAPPRPTAAPIVDATPVERVTIGPTTVHHVDELLGTFVVVVATGERIAVDERADADDLAKFKGTDHTLRLTCERTPDGLRLVRFELAD